MKFKKEKLSSKWNKKKLCWSSTAPKELKKNKLFFQCPNCKKNKCLTWFWVIKDNIIKTVNWFCTKCLTEVDSKELSEITKNYLKLRAIDLYEILTHPVKMVITNRKGTKIDGKFSAIGSIGVQYMGESLIKKCGYCGKKNKFRVHSEKGKLEQCLNCGFINKI